MIAQKLRSRCLRTAKARSSARSWGIKKVATRDSYFVICASPRATALYAAGVNLCEIVIHKCNQFTSYRIVLLTHRIKLSIVFISTPFPHISPHIIQAVVVGRKASNGSRTVPYIFTTFAFIVGIIVGDCIPPRITRPATPTARRAPILPQSEVVCQPIGHRQQRQTTTHPQRVGQVH